MTKNRFNFEDDIPNTVIDVWRKYHQSVDLDYRERVLNLGLLDDELWNRAWCNRAEERRKANRK